MLMNGDLDTVPRINNAGVYPYVCVEIDVHALAVSTILQSSHVNDIEGVGGSTIALDSLGQSSLEDMMGAKVRITYIDERVSVCEYSPAPSFDRVGSQR